MRICESKPYLSARPLADVAPSQRHSYELLLDLLGSGFHVDVFNPQQHGGAPAQDEQAGEARGSDDIPRRRRRQKKRPPPPYIFNGEVSKTIWIRPADAAFNRWYLQALVCAAEHKKEVPHFQRSSVYMELLGVDVASKSRGHRAGRGLRFQDEEGSAMGLLAPRRDRHPRKRLLAHVLGEDAAGRPCLSVTRQTTEQQLVTNTFFN